MVGMLDRKLLRDVWRLRGQMLTIAPVVAAGIVGYLARESPYRVGIANAGLPNMLAQISTAMGTAGLNNHNMVNKSRGEMADTLVGVDSPVEQQVVDALAAIYGVLSVRSIPVRAE